MFVRYLTRSLIAAFATAAACLALIAPAGAQDGASTESYDVQAAVVDQTSEHIDLAISIRLSDGSAPFHLAEQNYRFGYDNSVLDFWSRIEGGDQSIYLVPQDGHLSGLVEQDGFTPTVYSTPTVQGSAADDAVAQGLISVNMSLSGGPGLLLTSDWYEVTRIRLFIDDPAVVPSTGLIEWIDSDGFPPTTIVGLIDGARTTVFGDVFELVEATVPVDSDVIPAVTCLAGNGRIDINLINRGEVAATYRMTIGSLRPRQNTVNPDSWWRSPVTGRPDGPIQATVTRDGETIFDQTLTVACDDAPAVTTPEVQIMSFCLAGRGMILTQFANPTAQARSYIADVGGIRRSTTAAAFGASVRGVSGRPDGDFVVNIETGGNVIATETVTVNCS